MTDLQARRQGSAAQPLTVRRPKSLAAGRSAMRVGLVLLAVLASAGVQAPAFAAQAAGAAVAQSPARPRLLNDLFQDHAVLQRDEPIAVWGQAAAAEVVTLTLQATLTAPVVATVRTQADQAGHWNAVLPPMSAGGPFVLTAQGSSGTRLAARDVLIGDVFLCSGQSNMEMQVPGAANSDAEIRSSANNTIRLLSIEHDISPTALTIFRKPVAWKSAAPENVPDWSAVCFFFARELQAATHVPIGLVQSAWGGSNIRPWISAPGLHAHGGYESGLSLLKLYANEPAAAQRQFAQQWEQWWRGTTGDRRGAEPWSSRAVAASGQWRTAPNGLGDWRTWGVPELAGFTGSVWYRTRVTLTAAQAKSAASVSLGPINQVDETWINGHALGNTFGYETERTYAVPTGVLRTGENVVVINVTTTYGAGGLLGNSARRVLQLAGGQSVPLDGAWQYRIVPSSIGYPPRSPWESVGGLSTMYNAMIAPLGSYGLRGALWYQGESNTGEAQTYRALLQALMADWRRQFGADLPFLIVQLPNFGPPPITPVESGWSEVREAQRRAVASDPHAGLAVAIDIGDPRNLHPTNKQDVGKRLARAARHVIFGESRPPSGPTAVSATRSADRIAVEFTDIEDGLVTYSHATPVGFELCGDTPGSCRFADARIDGPRVLLSVPGSDAPPARVRYCWGDSPVCTLYDRSGLPAGPFELSVVPPPVHLSSEQDHTRTMAPLQIGSGLQAGQRSSSLGIFESHSDVGSVKPAGTASFSPATGRYTLTAAGANTWYHVDNFHYLWKKVSGDLALTADVTFPPQTYNHAPDPHRKGILMFRQTLDAGGEYVGASWHGSGLMALQFRRERGLNSEDVELNMDAPTIVRIEKRGDTFTLFLSRKGEPLQPAGASVTLHLKEPFYVGLGAVSHDVNTTDKVEFSHVSLQPLAPAAANLQPSLYSTVQTISINDQFRRAMIVRSVKAYVQSPNWAPDGKSIYVHEDGHILKIPYLDPPAGGPPQSIDTGPLVGCSGNFGLSPDGKLLAVSCAQGKDHQHDVYVLPAAGSGPPRKVTTGTTSSYFHAWAPDSRTLAFTRGSAGKADIFTVPVEGGPEARLTNDTINDGPDYSPDGKFIYFDSWRSGGLQIWRMQPDGTAPEQITDDDNLNSSPHVAPDGKTVAFLSEQPGQTGSAAMGAAALKVITAADGLIRTVANFQGNRGSFSMYGWGDATHLAFVSYQMLPDGEAATRTAGQGSSAGGAAARAARDEALAAGTPQAASSALRAQITGVSHIAVYATDPAKTERFYVHDLGAIKGDDPEDPQGVRYYFAPTQFVEVLRLPSGSTSINRLDHVAFTTTDAQSLRKYLAARKIATPRKLEQGGDGSRWFDVIDPEGNRIEFVQPPATTLDLPPNPLSNHIIHVGFIVHNRELEDTFFRAVLGFRPYWFGGMKDDTPTWISQQVPDGTDWLEYMIVGSPDGRGIPATMSRADLGVLDHFSLGVPSVQAAYTLLWNEDRLAGQSNTPKIGRDAKWQLNLLDPDGTRAEIMELHAIGKPCCSPFTASDPQR